MIIEVSKLDFEETRFKGEEPAEALDVGETDEVRPAGPVRYDLKAAMVDGTVVVRGAVEADVTFLCARCAEPFRQTVRDNDFMAVVESPNKDESLDLTPDIRESIILAFPTIPICSKSCKGLCPRCGTNFNKGACKCPPPASDGQWQVLGNLRVD